jgi:hypothetical protein
MLPLRIILLMLFAAYQAGDMPQLQGLLRYKLLSPEFRRYFLRNLADHCAKMTPRQRRELIKHRLRVVVCAKFLGKQSWQDHPITIPVQLLWHLMTIGIPRQIKLKPIDIPRVRYEDMLKLFRSIPINSVICDSSGGQWKAGSAYRFSTGILTTDHVTRGIVHMTEHSNGIFIAMICNNGNVSIGKSDDPNYLMRIIYYNEKFSQIDRACSCEFHPFNPIIAIGFIGSVKIIRFSSTLDSFEIIKSIPFKGLETIFFTQVSVTFPVNQIKWNRSGTILTAISPPYGVGLAKAFVLDENFGVKFEAANCAYTSSLSAERTAPRCFCFSSDGNLAVTSYSNGSLHFWRVTQGSEDIFEILKSECLLGENWFIKKIMHYPNDASMFAIHATSCGQSDTLYIVGISASLELKILKTINCIKDFGFHGNCLLIQGRDQIILYLLNSDNILVEMTDFRLQIGEFESCLLVTVNGNVKLCYTIKGSPQLHTVEVEFK